jgi:hypothetical protein
VSFTASFVLIRLPDDHFCLIIGSLISRTAHALPPHQFPHEPLFLKLLQEPIAVLCFDLTELGIGFDQWVDHGLHRLHPPLIQNLDRCSWAESREEVICELRLSELAKSRAEG